MRLTPEAEELLKAGGGKARGYVPRATPGGTVELVPWHRSTRINKRLSDGTETPNEWNARLLATTPVPATMQRAMFEGLEPTRRREASERYDALVRRLLSEMRKVKQVLGKAVVPESVAAQIRHVSWIEGDPGLLDRIEQVEPAAIETYAKFLMQDAASRQRAKDQKKVVLDWHGHDNTSIELRPRQASKAVVTPSGG